MFSKDETSVMGHFILNRKGDGDGECLWEENEWAGMSAVAANWRAGRLAVCPAGRINPAIHLYR